MSHIIKTATLGGGCFWCLDAIFDSLRGVEKVVSGYSGGSSHIPSYQDVCTGSTGHAEIIQITFDSQIISFKELLEVFFTVHDPTKLNRQGADVGTQYRSVIFYHTPEQEEIAREVIAEFDAKKIWDGAIVTEVTPFTEFYPAEVYHQKYFLHNPDKQYCNLVIAPKVAKFRNKFMTKLKK